MASVGAPVSLLAGPLSRMDSRSHRGRTGPHRLSSPGVGVGEKCQIHQPRTVTSLSGELPCRAVSLVSDRLCRACNRMSGQGAAHLRPSGEEGVGQGIKVPRTESRCWSLVQREGLVAFHLSSWSKRVCPVCLFLPRPSFPRVHASHTCRCCCCVRRSACDSILESRQDRDRHLQSANIRSHAPSQMPTKNARNQSPAPPSDHGPWTTRPACDSRYEVADLPCSRSGKTA